MSGQHGQTTSTRVLKSSPSSMKPGPMKATIPMASVLKQSNNFKNANSPTLSPTSCCKTRISPDHCSGQRSPGSAVYKAKSKPTSGVNNGSGSTMRRTASLDTIYLKGQWPRETYWHTTNLQIDKATQTDEADWLEVRKIHSIAEIDDKIDKMTIRQKLQRSNNQQQLGRRVISPGSIAIACDHTLSASSQTTTSYLISPLPRANPVNIPIKPIPKPTMRSSVEGLNQEIERLVLRDGESGSHASDKGDFDKFRLVTPEGHRAPPPDLFRTRRSVNTQTPSSSDVLGSCTSSGGSQGSSPDQEGNKLGSSPQLFLSRGPPDGCEKVHLKSVEDGRRSLTLDHVPQPCTFQLKPSLGSAFQILQPNLHSSTNTDIPLVPSEQDLM